VASSPIASEWTGRPGAEEQPSSRFRLSPSSQEAGTPVQKHEEEGPPQKKRASACSFRHRVAEKHANEWGNIVSDAFYVPV